MDEGNTYKTLYMNSVDKCNRFARAMGFLQGLYYEERDDIKLLFDACQESEAKLELTFLEISTRYAEKRNRQE